MEQKNKNKRVKRVFGGFSDITHLWANQTQSDARCGNGFFEGEIIYSYGRHFPIARIYTDKKGKQTVFFTTRTYSSTTGKHINQTRWACNHKDILYMRKPILGEFSSKSSFTYLHEENVADFIYDIKELMSKFSKARNNKACHLSHARNKVNQLEKYLNFFKCKQKAGKMVSNLIKDVKSNKYDLIIEEFKKKEEARLSDPKLLEKREKSRLARERAEETENAEQIQKWRNFEAYTPYIQRKRRRGYYYDYQRKELLRYNAEQNRIETSQRVQIPAEIAHKFYRYIQIVLAKGQCTSEAECNYRLMDTYDVKEITIEHLKIGCHCIPMSEVENIAKQLGWKE